MNSERFSSKTFLGKIKSSVKLFSQCWHCCTPLKKTKQQLLYKLTFSTTDWKRIGIAKFLWLYFENVSILKFIFSNTYFSSFCVEFCTKKNYPQVKKTRFLISWDGLLQSEICQVYISLTRIFELMYFVKL